ncbi:hypothetical protein HAHE_24730 [Haloferula helveola]|uniref:Lipoprotein n=1 Tax=Haloferula helveola TaxID=490095 RepID=A0ABM7RGT2_9BACT|nr:hypothetical protein HAHE_24730 [Haloferula helveola]
MRLLLTLPFLAVLASCANSASQSQILNRAKAEVAYRESWSDAAYIRVDEKPGHGCRLWKVTAGAFDYSSYPDYQGIELVPGTERRMCFTKDGCLLRYVDESSRCIVPPQPYVAPVTDSKSGMGK